MYYIDFVFLVAALIGFKKPHVPQNKKVWLQQWCHKCGISSLSSKMRPSINNEQYYEYLFTYTDPPDDLFKASSLAQLKEEGSYT